MSLDYESLPSSHQFACPWWGWEAYAGVSALIYLTAIFGMTGLNNNYAAAGWAVTSLLCFLWFLFFRSERRAQPLRFPLRSIPGALDAPLTSAYPKQLPFYCAQPSLALIAGICAAVLVMAIAFLWLSIERREPLTGSSLWMAFISWTMAAKCGVQLLASLMRGRRRWLEAIAQGEAYDQRAKLPQLHHVM